MSRNDKIKLGAAIGVFVVAGAIITWQMPSCSERPTKLDPERAGPVVEPPKNPKGQVETQFGNRAVPPR